MISLVLLIYLLIFLQLFGGLVSAQTPVFNTTSVSFPTATAASPSQATMLSAAQTSSVPISKLTYPIATYSSTLSPFLNLGQLLRSALTPSVLTIVSNSQLDITAALSNSVWALVFASFCLLLAIVTILIVPCLSYGFIKSLTIPKETEEGASLLQNSTFGLLKNPGAPGVDDEKQNKVYSQTQRNVANAGLFVAMMLSMAFLVLAYAGTIRSDFGINNMYILAGNIFTGILASTDSMAKVASTGITPARASDFSSYISQATSFDTISCAYTPVSSVNQSFWDISLNTMKSLYEIQSQLATYNSTLTVLSSDVNSFQNFLNNPTFLTTPQNNGVCVIDSSTFPPFLNSTTMRYQNWSSRFQPQAFPNSAAQATSILLPVLDTLLTDAATFQQNVRQNLGNAWKSAASSVASRINLAFPVAMADVKTSMQWGQYNTLSTFNTILYYNSSKSVGTYVILSFTLISVIFSTISVMFKCLRFARFMNICNLLLAGLVWLFCGFTVLFAIFAGAACQELRYGHFANYTNQFNNLTFPKVSQYSINNYISMAYTARDSCYSRNSSAYLSLATKLGVDIANAHGASNAVDIAATGSYTDFVSAFNTDLTSKSYFSSDGYILDVNNWAATFILAPGGYPTFINGMQNIVNDLNVPIVDPTQSWFNLSDTAARSAFITLATSYVNGVTTSNFIGNSTASCPPIYKSASYISNMQNNLTAEFNSRLAQMNIDVAALNSSATRILQAIQYVNGNNTLISTQITGKIATNLGNFTASFGTNSIGSCLAPQNQNLYAGLSYTQIQSVNCTSIARDTFEFEDYLCAFVVPGYDLTYISLLFLAIFQTGYFLAVRVCLRRLVEDRRWLMMALLLKGSLNGDSLLNHSGNTGTKLRKVNNTGTTYLDEQDFKGFT